MLCGKELDPAAVSGLFGNEKAAAAFTDTPYNVKSDGHVAGKGTVRHREFPMATGEMSEDEFAAFLTSALSGICRHSAPGALIYTCMDWRHMSETLAAAPSAGCELLNLCVSVQHNGARGSPCRFPPAL